MHKLKSQKLSRGRRFDESNFHKFVTPIKNNYYDVMLFIAYRVCKERKER